MSNWSPFRSITGIYITIILIGTLLLLLPSSSMDISFIDALFTSTSAVCVTGLIVKDTAIDFSFSGKGIILFLIQIGGMGYMAFASLFMTILRLKPDRRQGMVVKEEFGLFSRDNFPTFLRMVVITTFSFEIIGFVLFYFGFRNANFNINDSISHAIFHSVSAFCNAGFSSFSENLGNFLNDPIIAFTTPFLFIMGGLGFIVLKDISKRIRGFKNHLSEHTRIVLFTTIALIIIGTLAIFLLEFGSYFEDYSLIEKITASFFTATTPRTAGFSLITIGSLIPTTLIILIMFMFIGASPGGTGGGIKTTTFVIVGAFIRSKIKGFKSVNIEKRRISEEQVNKALTLFFISLILIFSVVSILSFSEMDLIKERGILPLVFEEFSAFGTVGLSMGSSERPNLSLSHDFSTLGKLLIIITMIAGRVGPLTLAAIILSGRIVESFKYPPARVQIG